MAPSDDDRTVSHRGAEGSDQVTKGSHLNNTLHSDASVQGVAAPPMVPGTKQKGKKGKKQGTFEEMASRDSERVELIARATAVASKKGELHHQALVLLQQKLSELDESTENLREELTSIFRISTETQTKISKMQETISMQEATIARLTQKQMDLESKCKNGILIWEIKRYSEQKADARDGNPASLYSREFASSEFGYRMCARLYLNGDGVGKGTHLSLFFAVKRGPYDNILAWPFRPKVTFRMLNQAGKQPIEDAFYPDPESISFRKPTKDINVAAGCPKFALQHHIENPQSGFLVNNTLFLMVKIDTSNLEF